MPRAVSAYLLLGTLVAFLSGAAQGQVHSLLTGTVTDQSDGVISGAKLSLANIATGIAYSAESNETGIYLFPAVGQGVKGGVNLDHFGGAKVDQLVKG